MTGTLQITILTLLPLGAKPFDRKLLFPTYTTNKSKNLPREWLSVIYEELDKALNTYCTLLVIPPQNGYRNDCKITMSKRVV